MLFHYTAAHGYTGQQLHHPLVQWAIRLSNSAMRAFSSESSKSEHASLPTAQQTSRSCLERNRKLTRRIHRMPEFEAMRPRQAPLRGVR